MKKIFTLAACIFIFVAGLFSQTAFEFIDKDLSEIFYAVSLYRKVPIVADDTVSGRASFRFAGNDFDSAFESFLKSCRLYVYKESDAWTITRIFIEKRDNRFFLDASDVNAGRLVERLSEYFSQAITFDSLPDNNISIHVNAENLNDLLETLVKQFGPSYYCQNEKDCIHIRYRQTDSLQSSPAFGKILIEQIEQKENDEEENLFDIDIEASAAGSVLEELFRISKRHFVFSCETSNLVRRLYACSKSFYECLDLICSCSNLEWTEVDEMVYIIPESKKVNSVRDAGKVWEKYSFLYCTASKASLLLNQRFGQQSFVLLENENALLCFALPQIQDEIKTFINTFDTKASLRTVDLQYIKVEDLISHLPSGIEKGQIFRGTQDNIFFFTGSEGQYELLLDCIKILDVNAKRVRYDLLVMQYQSTDDFTFDHTLSSKRLAMGDRNGVSAVLGSVLNLNMDVVGAFGMKFASALQAAINENHAKVYADTTLQGLSGATISFKNTNTYRYRDNNLDPETGKPVYSGVTREIVSGLKIDITGWVSGDGMITSKVTASVSRQGADLSSTTGNPPPTSEKIITTEVLGKSGEPLVLSGLIQDDEALVEERTPFLSKIPILGWLFKSHKKTKEKSEVVIYLVPHWEESFSKEEIDSVKCEDFEKFSNDFLNQREKGKDDERL